MVLKTKELFEIPIYRLDSDKYNQEFENYKNKSPSVSEQHLRKTFGGSWQYNEIIGYLKFYRSGKRQIRCEYWDTDSKAKRRTRKKQFEMKSDSLCTREFYPTMDNHKLKPLILDCIDHCKNQLSKNRYVDTRLFMETFDYIDWHELLNS